MILEAEAILKGALQRNESRGAHFKPEFPERNDADYLKATIVTYDAADGSARITYAPVDISLIPPRARTYGKKDAAAVGSSSGTAAQQQASNGAATLATANTSAAGT
jgi:succinate dehydrogenase / fumarate reductase flavoprotein subunit